MKTLLLSIFLLLMSCSSTKKIWYMQDIKLDESIAMQEPEEIRLMPKDKISIKIKSKDDELTQQFNLTQIGSTTINEGGDGYTIDVDGYIDFPSLGKIKISGLTREEVELLIKDKLIDGIFLKEVVVLVRFDNLRISVIGEVNVPGFLKIDKDVITIIDALTMAGDLTIMGLRDEIYVMRNVDNKQQSYKINLLSVEELFASPAYYLHQNDIVYVKPNSVRTGESTINANSMKSVSMWMGITSFLISLGTLLAVTIN